MTRQSAQPKKAYVVDTNVFLADPLAIYGFPGADVLIPDIVLSELDRLKLSKADKRLRYRGREVSRILFGLSERGLLLEGIPVDEDSIVRVVPLDTDARIPSTLNPRGTDDRILAVAYQLAQSGKDVTLVTNDLNMLLKAQALEIPVERYGEDEEHTLGRRFVQAAKRNRAVTASVIVGLVALGFALYALSVSTQGGGQAQMPPQQQTTAAQEYQYLQALSRNPKDINALVGLANIYFDSGKAAGDSARLRQAADLYRRAVAIQPSNADVRTDLAITHFYLGSVDEAIREARAALKHGPDHTLAHYNLGVFYWKGKKDDVNAVREFEAAIKTDKVGEVADQSRELLQEIRLQQRQGGK